MGTTPVGGHRRPSAFARLALDPASEVLRIVGLGDVAGRRAKSLSLGTDQLGIASALLRDPAVLIVDEPVNGLEPDGIRWVT